MWSSHLSKHAGIQAWPSPGCRQYWEVISQAWGSESVESTAMIPQLCDGLVLHKQKAVQTFWTVLQSPHWDQRNFWSRLIDARYWGSGAVPEGCLEVSLCACRGGCKGYGGWKLKMFTEALASPKWKWKKSHVFGKSNVETPTLPDQVIQTGLTLASNGNSVYGVRCIFYFFLLHSFLSILLLYHAVDTHLLFVHTVGKK